MPIDTNILLYSLANTFANILGVPISKKTTKYLNNGLQNFTELSLEDRIYYTKYSIKLAQNLSEYIKGIKLFEINTDSEPDVIHDFRLKWKKDNITHISMSHSGINIRDIIPEKLMKICKYKKNTKTCKYFMENYKKITTKAYKKLQTSTKYSELSDKSKNSNLIEPVCNLVIGTLSKKRKCASHLYNHLFPETDRIVLKLYKNRFTIYDFGKELNDVESFRMKINGNRITITFNNTVKFALVLHTNASEIKEHISLKFHTRMENIDELFAVSSSSV